MQIFIFAVGFFVSLMFVYGLFSLVPGEMRPPEKVVYHGTDEKNEKQL